MRSNWVRWVTVGLLFVVVASAILALATTGERLAAQELATWTRQFGTSSDDMGTGVSADPSGNVYVAGNIRGGALPGQVSSGGADAFLRKYDPSGIEVWTRQFGSSMTEYAWGVAVDPSGNAYVAGWTDGALPGQTSSGSYDAFLRAYDASGNVLWTRQFGASSSDHAWGVSVDPSGNAYVAGYTWGVLPGQTSSGGVDAFVRKHDPSGNEVWTRQFGSSAQEVGQSVSASSSGSVYVAGLTNGALPGQTSSGYEDVFLRKYDASGNEVWTRQFGRSAGGAGGQEVGVSADPAGNVYVTGRIFGALPGQASSGGFDVFLRKYDANGTTDAAAPPPPPTPVPPPPTPTPTPSKVLSPVVGPLRATGTENPDCVSVPDLWTFCQHKTGGHAPGGGIGNVVGHVGADDTLAWDVNLLEDADAGKPVFAVASGKVATTYGSFLNAGGSYGQLLVEHPFEGGMWWSGYLHLKDIQVTPGQPVTENTVLGFISNTSPDPIPNHLHFVVYTGSNTEGGLRSFGTTIAERPSTSDLEVTIVLVNGLGGGIPVQGEPAVIEIGVRNVGNQSIPTSLANLFIAVEDLAGKGLADIPFVQRIDGADLFQAEIRQVVVPALAPNATGTFRVGEAVGDKFVFLSAAYSDRLRVQLLFKDDNLTNNGGELAPLGILPSLDTAFNCISNMLTVGLAPAAVGAQSTAVTLTALGTDLAVGGTIDFYQLSSAIKQGDVNSAANKVATQTLRLSRVGAQAVGKETVGKALGFTKLGWGVMNAAKTEAHFSGCGEAFAIVPRMMGEMVKDLVRQAFIMLQGAGQKIWLFFAGSPVDLSVEDGAGRVSFAKHGGVTEQAIPDSFALVLDIEPKPKVVIVLGGGSFDLRLAGVDVGLTQLDILQPTSAGSLVNFEFKDIPTKAGSVANTTIEPQTAEVALALDIDGDGATDETRLPNHVETLVAPLSTPTPIPGLSQWGLIVLALLLAGLGHLRLRQMRARGT